MSKATSLRGNLIGLSKCYITIPGFGNIVLNNLPEISDSKSAAYNDEPVMGRSNPIKTYSHSENRVISFQINFIVINPKDVSENIRKVRALQSVLYPRDGTANGAPYRPPPICKLRCGNVLADEDLCVILRSLGLRHPTDVPWDEDKYWPHKVTADTSWEVVYTSDDLPGQERIIRTGS